MLLQYYIDTLPREESTPVYNWTDQVYTIYITFAAYPVLQILLTT
jgi:hypothetical protein